MFKDNNKKPPPRPPVKTTTAGTPIESMQKNKLDQRIKLLEDLLNRCEKDYRALADEKAFNNFQFHDVKARALETADFIKAALDGGTNENRSN